MRKRYRFVVRGMTMTNPDATLADMKSLAKLYDYNGKTYTIEVYDPKFDMWMPINAETRRKHTPSRNKSGSPKGRLVRFMPMATQWEQYSGWEGYAFADPSNDGYYHVTWRHHREGMPTYVHAHHLSFKIRKLSKRFAVS